jgi:hypothetical protein
VPTGQVDDMGANQHRGHVSPVGTRVHPDATADRPRDGADELQPSEPCVAGAVETDGEGRASAGDQPFVGHLDRREHTGELERETGEAAVSNEEVGAESNRGDQDLLLHCPVDELAELGNSLGTGEPRRRPASSERRELRKLDVGLDLHASPSSKSGTARSTSPAPIVAMRSPGRA